ncbi:MAG: helicase-related protein [Candidatus Sumerlaeota bacterium]|nr:helicase-related protein [Candidatus Sumerlaeota bacterium]
MSFAVGSLVEARGREWIVLPESSDDLLLLRPLHGGDAEIAGVYLPLEKVNSASFDLPDPQKLGDHRSCKFLRDAVRLGFRSSAGPFRSFAQIAVDPRPYQMVPLLMALKLDHVRMLIADDVGIGKTIEACLVVREMLDRAEIHRIAVLCPPHLAEQWQGEMRDKFHIEAELVLSATVGRLERHCGPGQSLFDRYQHVVVSVDFIKSDRYRHEFINHCPEMLIVDEAHSCAFGYSGRGGRQQRHQLIRDLSANANRHIILVTATPHSGNEEAFRFLLSFINPDFANLPQDLSGAANEPHRRRLAAHLIQRRRADIRHYMKSDTQFPKRLEKEETYELTPEYKKLFERALEYARETVQDAGVGQFRQRVRWWSALALLRSLASSPAAAAATLRNRAPGLDMDDADEADDIGLRATQDLEQEDDSAERIDATPGCDPGDAHEEEKRLRRRLLDMAREADKLKGAKDAKLAKAIKIVKELVKEGLQPIVFCRFIDTADYVAEAMRAALKNVEVASITSVLPPAERELRIAQLVETPNRVLVCTDCLSEGINLQSGFNAVLHYDLSWNPTRHEQREGRVDRFGQPRPEVRVVTYYGADNQIEYAFSRAKWAHKILFGTGSEGKAKTSCGAWMTR